MLILRRGVPRWFAGWRSRRCSSTPTGSNAGGRSCPTCCSRRCWWPGSCCCCRGPGPEVLIIGGGRRSARPPGPPGGRASSRRAHLRRGGRPGLAQELLHGALMTACFALPVVGYMRLLRGDHALRVRAVRHGQRLLYGRTAHAADCAALEIPDVEQPLCPSAPVSARLGVDGLVNDEAAPRVLYRPGDVYLGEVIDTNPWRRRSPPPCSAAADARGGRHRPRLGEALRADQERPAGRHADLALAVPVRLPDLSARRHPARPDSAGRVFALAGGGGHARVPGRPTSRCGTTSCTAGTRRGRCSCSGCWPGSAASSPSGGAASPRLACLLITGCAVAVLLGADLYEFSWRYQLPALVTLPVAGAIGATALARVVRARRQRASRGRGAGSPGAAVPALHRGTGRAHYARRPPARVNRDGEAGGASGDAVNAARLRRGVRGHWMRLRRDQIGGATAPAAPSPSWRIVTRAGHPGRRGGFHLVEESATRWAAHLVVPAGWLAARGVGRAEAAAPAGARAGDRAAGPRAGPARVPAQLARGKQPGRVLLPGHGLHPGAPDWRPRSRPCARPG